MFPGFRGPYRLPPPHGTLKQRDTCTCPCHGAMTVPVFKDRSCKGCWEDRGKTLMEILALDGDAKVQA